MQLLSLGNYLDVAYKTQFR